MYRLSMFLHNRLVVWQLSPAIQQSPDWNFPQFRHATKYPTSGLVVLSSQQNNSIGEKKNKHFWIKLIGSNSV